MKPTLLYRAAAVLLLMFTVGHQVGYRQVDPSWNVDAVVEAMRTSQFTVQGFSRNYWTFFTGFGVFVSILLVFSAVLAWELSRATSTTLEALQHVRWVFAGAYVFVAIVAWVDFFAAPAVLATLTAICLIIAALRPASSA